MGKLILLSFVLFAGWTAGYEVPFSSYPIFAASGLFTFFGSEYAAIPKPALLSFVNHWIELKRKDGTMQMAFEYWILGRGVEKKKPPRWSIIRDVLHWTD